MKTAIQPTRQENYPEWYQQVIKAADLAENSPVRGCMIIKPWGYGIWERMQARLDKMFKDTGHVNAYFPLFIPLSYLQKEADHVDGFAKECAVVTHHRLEADSEGNLQPAGKLDEPLVVRPTSETIIGEAFSRWTQSYRDLPILVNQWANVVRWEMRTRLFLRTSEFLWQEGHTAHATKDEAIQETMQMLNVYRDFARDFNAMSVIHGEKTPDERFPGAEVTYTIEAMMQDKKALQAGTSHFLGQNFSKAADISFSDEKGGKQFAWTTSWGVSTRMVGGLVMTHSDDNGLVLPPKVAPQQIVICPVYKTPEQRSEVLEFCHNLRKELRSKKYDDEELRVHIDDRDIRGGGKQWEWIKKGVPIRIEVGKRDLDKGQVFMGRRDQDKKQGIAIEEFKSKVVEMLGEMQDNLLKKSEDFTNKNIETISSKDQFIEYFKNPDSGFARVNFALDSDYEQVCKKLKVSARCMPIEDQELSGDCVFSGKKPEKVALFGRSY